MADNTSFAVTEQVTHVSVVEEVVSINIVPAVTTIEAAGVAISLATAASLPFVPYGTITATNVQSALEQVADQDFRSDEQPTGANIGEGDTWYDLNDNQLKVYRETSVGVFEWVPIMIGNISPDSDTLDAGAF